jgi:L-alanine-DL-glutamate epimerase-like enolase superfamily enzyme
MLGIENPRPLVTAYTISLGSPAEMAKATAANAHRPLLKIKLGGDGDDERLAAVAEVSGGARLIADANEAWAERDLESRLALCARLGVDLVEQPLAQDRDAALAEIRRAVPVCADESLHVAADIGRLAGRYDAVNIKLDKAGGLTGALGLKAGARKAGLQIMVGCMVATSLAMAPAVLLAQDADYVDLDGPLLLARDRERGLRYEGSLVDPPVPELWG